MIVVKNGSLSCLTQHYEQGCHWHVLANYADCIASFSNVFICDMFLTCERQVNPMLML